MRILLSLLVSAHCIATYQQPAGAGSGQCSWWSEVDTCEWRMVGAANPTAGQSAGTLTGSPAGLMMEEALLRQSRSDLKVQIQQFSVN